MTTQSDRLNSIRNLAALVMSDLAKQPQGTRVPLRDAADISALCNAIVTAKTSVDNKAASKLAATATRQAAGDALDAARIAFAANQADATLADAYINAGLALSAAQAEDDAATDGYRTARGNLGAARDALNDALEPYITG